MWAVILSFISLCLSVSPPGELFDLSHFKLQLPTCTPPTCKPDSVDEISQPALKNYTSSYFYTDPETQEMTFWCPIDGKTTKGSSFPRSELRETQDLSWNSDGKGDWTLIGFHQLNVTLKVLEVPESGTITIGQAHGITTGNNPLEGACAIISEFEWKKGQLVNRLTAPQKGNNCPDHFDTQSGTYELGETFSYSITLNNKDLSIWTTKGGWSKAYSYSWLETSGSNTYWLYFKMGDYVQDNGSSSTIGGKVAVSAIKVYHAPN